MKRFDSDNYYTHITSDNVLDNIRRVERGFARFVTDAIAQVDTLTKERTFPISIVELGIGGGGSQKQYINNIAQATVYGVDLFSKLNQELYDSDLGTYGYYSKEFDRLAADQDCALSQLTEAVEDRTESLTTCNLHWGLDGYAKSTAELITGVNKGKVDFVLDDASPQLGAINGLMNAWSDSISDDGIMISETPFGNGTIQMQEMPMATRLEYCNILAEQGMILFDMSEYATTSDNPHTGFIVSYMGVYATDFNKFSALLTAHEHNIIAGKSNWKK